MLSGGDNYGQSSAPGGLFKARVRAGGSHSLSRVDLFIQTPTVQCWGFGFCLQHSALPSQPLAGEECIRHLMGTPVVHQPSIDAPSAAVSPASFAVPGCEQRFDAPKEPLVALGVSRCVDGKASSTLSRPVGQPVGRFEDVGSGLWWAPYGAQRLADLDVTRKRCSAEPATPLRLLPLRTPVDPAAEMASFLSAMPSIVEARASQLDSSHHPRQSPHQANIEAPSREGDNHRVQFTDPSARIPMSPRIR